MKKDLILAKDYDEYRTAKTKKNKDYYDYCRNLSDKEEKEDKKKVEAKVETTEDVVLPFGNNNAK